MRLCILTLLVALYGFAHAQEHTGHRPQDMAIHEQFYSTWMQPDNRSVSCCSGRDCQPAQYKFEFGHVFARHEGGEWVQVPNQKIETERDSPDGRSHLCMHRNKLGQYSIYCFIRGAGT